MPRSRKLSEQALTFTTTWAIGRLGIGPLDFDQRIDAGAAFRQLIGTHAFLAMELRAAPRKESGGRLVVRNTAGMKDGSLGDLRLLSQRRSTATAGGRTCG